MKRSFISLGLIALSLSAAVLIWAQFKPVAEPSITRPLAELITTGEAFGWTHEDLPLGPTEAIAEASQDKLNMTDFLYRRYTKGPDSFDLYIGYWEPGRMPARMMNSHTPDSCWVNAGWSIIEKSSLTLSSPLLTKKTSQQNPTLKPGNWRKMENSGQSIQVVFWHILDGSTYQYGHQSWTKRLKQLVTDPFHYKFDLRREQYLIRVSSKKSLETIWKEPLVTCVIKDIRFTGIEN